MHITIKCIKEFLLLKWLNLEKQESKLVNNLMLTDKLLDDGLEHMMNQVLKD